MRGTKYYSGSRLEARDSDIGYNKHREQLNSIKSRQKSNMRKFYHILEILNHNPKLVIYLKFFSQKAWY